VLLVNATTPSYGTNMEILFAYENHKKIIAYTKQPLEKTSPWLMEHSTMIVTTLKEAIKTAILYSALNKQIKGWK
jgi:hypothetical protein